MSRLAKKPIKLLPGVTLTKGAGFILLKGPHGEGRARLPGGVDVRVEGENVWVQQVSGEGKNKANPGTAWALIKSAVQGVAEGFSKILEIEGIGYRALIEGKDLVLFLGYARPARFKIPDGVVIGLEKNLIKISGADKDLVGRVASDIRALKKPEPYKGKGIRYRGEVIKRKVGKKAGATATT